MGKSEETPEAFSSQQSTVGAGLVPARMRIAKFAPTGSVCYSKSNVCPPSVCQLVRSSNGIVRNPT